MNPFLLVMSGVLLTGAWAWAHHGQMDVASEWALVGALCFGAAMLDET